MITKIINGRILADTLITDKALYIRDGKILAITAETIDVETVIDAKNAYIIPGFVDIHTHGAGGTHFMDGTPEDVRGALRTHVKHGTTASMPTVTTANPESFRKSIEDIGAVMQEKDSALPEILGPIKANRVAIIEDGVAKMPDRLKFAEVLPQQTVFCV